MPKNGLFLLIKSLSTAEKRYFKRYAGRHAAQGSNAYLRVFEAINAQEAYDETKIKQLFDGESFIKQFPVTKNHLRKLILRSLRSFLNEQSLDSKLKVRLEEIEILFTRNLYDQARKTLKLTLPLAKEAEKFVYLQELFAWDRKLTKLGPDKGLAKRLETISKAEDENLEKLESEVRLQAQSDDMFELYRQNVRVRNPENLQKAQKLVEELNAFTRWRTLPFRAEQKANVIRARLCHLQGNTQEVYSHYFKNVKAWEAAGSKRNLFPDEYVRALSMLISSCHSAGEYEEYEDLMGKIRKLSGLSPHSQGMLLSTGHASKILYFLNNGKYDQAYASLPGLEENLGAIEATGNPQFWLANCYNAVTTCFVLQQFSPCLVWLNRILNYPKSPARQDLRDTAEMLNLVVHFELGNEQWVAQNLRRARKRLKSGSTDSQYEPALVKSLKKLVNTPEGNRKILFRTLANKIKVLLKSSEPNPYGMREVYCWTKYRSEGKSIREWMQYGT